MYILYSDLQVRVYAYIIRIYVNLDETGGGGRGGAGQTEENGTSFMRRTCELYGHIVGNRVVANCEVGSLVLLVVILVEEFSRQMHVRAAEQFFIYRY